MRKLFFMIICVALLTGCGAAKETGTYPEDCSFGVFIGAGPEALQKILEYDTVVIDAQYFTAEQIKEIHSVGHKVYSYINAGSLEDFRPYYQEYEQYTLGAYEHWDEERWVDVSVQAWQDFVLKSLAPDILGKGVDGLFVDNADVYYMYQSPEIFDGLEIILKGLQSMDTYVVINGGDTFVTEYMDHGGKFCDIADAVNQESVFGRIEWDENRFSENDPDERAYFQEYVEKVAADGGDIYLLEYTTDSKLIKQIKAYCRKHHFRYYISTTLELL